MIPDHPRGDPEVQEARRSKKSKKNIPENPDFPDPDIRMGPGPSGGQGESLDTHIVGSLSLKSRKNEKSGFSKNRISRSGSGLGGTGTSGG